MLWVSSGRASSCWRNYKVAGNSSDKWLPMRRFLALAPPQDRRAIARNFRWVEDEQILSRAFPEDAIFFERWEWGHLFGFLKKVTQDGKVIAEGSVEAWKKFQEIHPLTQETLEHIHYIERKEIGAINYDIERSRLQI